MPWQLWIASWKDTSLSGDFLCLTIHLWSTWVGVTLCPSLNQNPENIREEDRCNEEMGISPYENISLCEYLLSPSLSDFMPTVYYFFNVPIQTGSYYWAGELIIFNLQLCCQHWHGKSEVRSWTGYILWDILCQTILTPTFLESQPAISMINLI